MKKRQWTNCTRSVSHPQRRAQAVPTVFFMLAEILLVVMAGWIILGKINSLGEDNFFTKKFLARDIAVTIDALQGLQGNVVYFYSSAKEGLLSSLVFQISSTLIDINGEKYPVMANVDATTVNKPKSLRLAKEGDKITVDAVETKEQRQFNLHKMTCPKVQTKVKNLILDAGHGYNTETEKGDVGFESNQGKESQITGAITQNLITQLRSRGIEPKTTRTPSTVPEDAKTLEQRQNAAKESDTIVSLHVNKENEKNNFVRAYVNVESEKYEESVKLACLILNEVSYTFPTKTTGTLITPILEAQLNDDDSRLLLSKSKVAVHVEVGNINGTSTFLKETDKVSNAIAVGIKKYDE